MKRIKTEDKNHCVICLEENNKDSLELTCKHEFHEQCIKSLHDTTCPVCRHPITILKPEELDAMHQRHEQDAVDRDREAIFESFASQHISIGTPAFKRGLEIIFKEQRIPVQMVVGTPLPILQLILRPYLARLHLNMRVVDFFVEEVQHIFSESISLVLNTTHENYNEIVEWMKEHAVLPDPISHQLAHAKFPNLPCSVLYRYLLDARRICVGETLIELCF